MSFQTLAVSLLSGRPYLGPALRAMQGSPERHRYFLPLVSRVVHNNPNRPIRILEIGSWAGGSALSWAAALRKTGVPGQITCVDPWKPYFDTATDAAPHYAEMNQAASGDLIVRLFEHNLRSAGIEDLVRVERGTSREVLPRLPDAGFDVIYIDGSHRFEDVLFDIGEARRLAALGGCICGDDLELEARALPPEELLFAAEALGDYVYSPTARAYYHPGVTRAVAESFPAVAEWEGFWAVESQFGEWAPAQLDTSTLELPEHLVEEHPAALVESTATHNIAVMGGRFCAVAKSLGQIDLFIEPLGGRDLPPVLFTGSSLDEVRAKLAVLASSEQRGGAPMLIGHYLNYNLVQSEGRYFALSTALGQVDVTVGEAELEHRYGAGPVLFADNLDVLKARIDARAASQHTAALAEQVTALRHSLDHERTARSREAAAEARARTSQMGDISAALHGEIQIRSEQIAATTAALGAESELRHQQIIATNTALGAESETRTQQFNALFAAQSAMDQARERDAAALADTIQRLKSTLANETASLSASLSAEVEARSRETIALQAAQTIETAAREQAIDTLTFKTSDLSAAVARLENAATKREQQYNLLAARVQYMQFGPGDPETPCVGAEYRGFALVHYRGSVYGLRKPIDPEQVRLGEAALRDRHGAAAVLAGFSLDGLRARIDVLAELSELQSRIGAVEKESTLARAELEDGIRSAQASLETHTRALELLAANWPNRLPGTRKLR